MPVVTRASQKGQVVIPLEFRRALGIKAGDLIEIDLVDKLVVMKKVRLAPLRDDLLKAARH